MNLKRRLIIANIATVVIPVLITVFFALAYIYVYGKLFGVEVSFADYQKYSQLNLELISGQSVLRQSPELLEEQNYQQYLAKRLAEIRGELLITKDDHVVFESMSFNNIDRAKIIAAGDDDEGAGQVDIGKFKYTVEIYDFRYPDGKIGQLALLAPLGQTGIDLASLSTVSGVVFILAFLGTNGYVIYRFTRRAIVPLNNLQIAAAEISRGNLDFQIIEDGDREIQALCRDLELMRLKLKDSIHTQLKYEDNRKLLISSISHDLKTPVTSIKGYVEGILDGIANTPEKRERYLKTIYNKAEQLDRMIDDLLLYAKLDLKQIPFNFERVNIEEYLKDCLAESEPELAANRIKLEFVSELSRPHIIQLDQERIKRVLMNILDNSRKYMDKAEGEIRVSLRETMTSLIIEIRDNGSGIKESDLPHIFDRFYRSDPARTEIKGSGLGLAIAKQLVEGHQGRIWAISHGEAGTSMIISLSKELI